MQMAKPSITAWVFGQGKPQTRRLRLSGAKGNSQE
jgi:hypothetical protein